MKKTFFNFGLFFVLISFFAISCKNSGGGTSSGAATTDGATGLKIAYVNLDSFEAHYDFLKTKRDEFQKNQEKGEAELQQSYVQMQQKGQEMQRKAQTMTQTEIQAAEKQLMLMQQSLENRRQALTDQLMKEREEFNKDLKKRLDSFLVGYNKDKKYDYILSYSAGGGSPIMYANPKYDITKDVIDGMNKSGAAEVKK